MGIERLILPTGDLVRQFRDYERLFVFYQDGVKGIIRDTIVLSDDGSYLPKREQCASGNRFLIERIVRLYENSAEALCAFHQENTTAVDSVEVAVTEIHTAVAEMLQWLLAKHEYYVCRHQHQWLGNDLLVTIYQPHTQVLRQGSPCIRIFSS